MCSEAATNTIYLLLCTSISQKAKTNCNTHTYVATDESRNKEERSRLPQELIDGAAEWVSDQDS